MSFLKWHQQQLYHTNHPITSMPIEIIGELRDNYRPIKPSVYARCYTALVSLCWTSHTINMLPTNTNPISQFLRALTMILPAMLIHMYEFCSCYLGKIFLAFNTWKSMPENFRPCDLTNVDISCAYIIENNKVICGKALQKRFAKDLRFKNSQSAIYLDDNVIVTNDITKTTDRIERFKTHLDAELVRHVNNPNIYKQLQELRVNLDTVEVKQQSTLDSVIATTQQIINSVPQPYIQVAQSAVLLLDRPTAIVAATAVFNQLVSTNLILCIGTVITAHYGYTQLPRIRDNIINITQPYTTSVRRVISNTALYMNNGALYLQHTQQRLSAYMFRVSMFPAVLYDNTTRSIAQVIHNLPSRHSVQEMFCNTFIMPVTRTITSAISATYEAVYNLFAAITNKPKALLRYVYAHYQQPEMIATHFFSIMTTLLTIQMFAFAPEVALEGGLVGRNDTTPLIVGRFGGF